MLWLPESICNILENENCSSLKENEPFSGQRRAGRHEGGEMTEERGSARNLNCFGSQCGKYKPRHDGEYVDQQIYA